MRFKADSTFAPKLFKASSLREAVVESLIQRERKGEREHMAPRTDVEEISQGCVTAQQEQLKNEQFESTVYVDLRLCGKALLFAHFCLC